MITAVRYREGQVVEKGAPLVDLDARPFQAQLDQARGTLARDQHLLDQAKMDLERYQIAWSKNAINKQQLDDQAHLVLQTQGTVQADQGAVAYAATQVSYCHITAPFEGRVGLRLVDPGNLVLANNTTPLVVVTEVDPITVVFAIPEERIAEVQAQMALGHTLKVDALDRMGEHTLATGKLTALDNQIDTTTGTVRLRAQFDNSNEKLFPNQFVNARLQVQVLSGVNLIPTSAIQRNGQTAFVYVIANGVARARTVKPGVSDQGFTAVEGVKPGEVVATSSFEKLHDGTHVTLAAQAPAAPRSEGLDP